MTCLMIQIDTSLIKEMALARYIPVCGDRLAKRRYCLVKQKLKGDKCSKMLGLAAPVKTSWSI